MQKPTFEDVLFDGDDYNHGRDNPRLVGQLYRIHKLMKDGQWRTLKQISEACDCPQASVSAQLRNLRKERFGAYNIEKHYYINGVYYYRMVIEDNGG